VSAGRKGRSVRPPGRGPEGEEPLDLLDGQTIPDVTATLQRFQRVLKRLELQQDEGDLNGPADEMASWAPEQARANQLIIRD
jgi:hypothetical protein